MEAQLLEAVHAARERDEPRLVYADWLLERQDPRGELIRLQVEQARLLRGSAAHARLQPRIDALLTAGRAVWRPKLLPHTVQDWRFTRGFITGLRVSAQAFAAEGAACFEGVPLLEELELDFGNVTPEQLATVGWLEQIFAIPQFAQVRTLRLEGINEVGVVALSGMDSHLQALTLQRVDLALKTYELLGSAGSRLRQLQSLELLLTNVRDVALEGLAGQPWPRLKALRVAHGECGPRGAAAIAARGLAPALQSLDLSWSLRGGAEAMKAFEGGTLPALEALDLSHCWFNDEMCEALLRADRKPLKVLRLAHSVLTGRGVAALLQAPFVDGLELLDLSGGRLDAHTHAAVIARLGNRVLL